MEIVLWSIIMCSLGFVIGFNTNWALEVYNKKHKEDED